MLNLNYFNLLSGQNVMACIKGFEETKDFPKESMAMDLQSYSLDGHSC